MIPRRRPFPFLDPHATQYDWEDAMDAAQEAEERAEQAADDAHSEPDDEG